MNAAKGIISSYDETLRKARVTFPQFDDGVTTELPVMFTPMIGFVVTGNLTASVEDPSGTIGGPFSVAGDMQVEYKPDIKIGDTVVVIFFSSGFKNGAVIGKVNI